MWTVAMLCFWKCSQFLVCPECVHFIIVPVHLPMQYLIDDTCNYWSTSHTSSRFRESDQSSCIYIQYRVLRHFVWVAVVFPKDSISVVWWMKQILGSAWIPFATLVCISFMPEALVLHLCHCIKLWCISVDIAPC